MYFITLELTSSIPQGTFQDYYERTLLPDTSASTIAFIGSLQTFFLYFIGPLVGRVFDAYGSKVSARLDFTP